MNYVMNPYHRSIANDVLDYCHSLLSLSHMWHRWLDIRKGNNLFDFYMFVNGRNILIGWKDVPYGFMIYPEENRVQVVEANG